MGFNFFPFLEFFVSPTVKEELQTVGWKAWQSYNYTIGDIKCRKNW